jgi:hypothetical protein
VIGGSVVRFAQMRSETAPAIHASENGTLRIVLT